MESDFLDIRKEGASKEKSKQDSHKTGVPKKNKNEEQGSQGVPKKYASLKVVINERE